MTNPKIKLHFAIIFFAVLGFLILFLITIKGIGVSPDSVGYIDSASNLLSGKGLVVTIAGYMPMTHYPPLYPGLLALVSLAGANPLNSARLLNCLIFGANIALAAFIIARCFGKPMMPAVCCAMLVLFSEISLRIHSMAWTEPLFIFFMLAGFYMLSRFIESSCAKYLVLSALLLSAAALARYAGMALFLTGCCAIVLFKNDKLEKKIVKLTLFFLFFSIPVLIWVIRNKLVAGTLPHRELSFHPLSFAHINQLTRTILFIFLPDNMVEKFKLFRFSYQTAIFAEILFAIVLLIFFICLFCLNSKIKNLLKQIPIFSNYLPVPVKIFSFFTVTYFLFLAISISFFDYSTPLCIRITSPVYISAVIIFTYLFYNFQHTHIKSSWSMVLNVVLMLFILTYVVRTVSFIKKASSEGIEYNSKLWENSEIIGFIRKTPENTPVFSNACMAILFHTGRVTNGIPPKIDQGSPKKDFIEKISGMEKLLQSQNGLLIYFKNVPEGNVPSEEEIKSMISLKKTISAPDGNVYKIQDIVP